MMASVKLHMNMLSKLHRVVQYGKPLIIGSC
jgi:hypothetical protein